MNRALILSVISVCVVFATLATAKPSSKNHDLLQKIGFSRVRAPNSHHRKRLAVESRHHSRSDDSHMFVIKLPPNQHYYVHNKPNQFIEPDKKVPVGFKSNGKPGKIYHWNIPVIKKIVQAKSRRNDDAHHQIDIKYYANWNEVLDKQHGDENSVLDHRSAMHKIGHAKLGYKKPSYYVPATVKKSSFLKYFPGNGKPQSFYVIEKNKRKHHHKLLN